MKESRIHFFNGNFIETPDLERLKTEVKISTNLEVFDFVITYQSQRPFMLDRHIDRLFNSATLFRINLLCSKEDLKGWIMATLQRNNNNSEKSILISIFSKSIPVPAQPIIVIECNDRLPFPEEFYTKGVKLDTASHRRYMPAAKSNNDIEYERQLKIKKQLDVFETVYHDEKQIFESSHSNIFALINNELVTPESHILHGVTRAVLIEILSLQTPVLVRDFTLDELMSAEEIFITGTNKEILPVTQINNEYIGKGRVGCVTLEIMKQFKGFTQSDNW